MWIEKGEKVKSKLNGQLYVVEEIDARGVVFESEDGLKQAWTNSEVMKYFFDWVEDDN
jgi:hypothetical protein